MARTGASRRMRIIATLAVISLVCSGTAFAGGTKDNGTPAASGQRPLTLTYWVNSDNIEGVCANYNEVLAYQELEQRTGVHVVFRHAPSGADQDKEQLALIVASRDLPDVIEADWKKVLPGALPQAYAEGLIVKLDDYLARDAPHFKKMIESRPEVAKQIKADDGSIYGFAGVYEDRIFQAIYFGPVVREDWLQKLNLDRPATIADWDHMMRMFREKDANGNGKPDEIGLIFEPWNIAYSGAFASAYGVTNDFYNDNGTVRYGFVQPVYKDFLTQMNKWYDDGLLDRDFASQNWDSFESKTVGNIAGAWLGWGSDLHKPVDPSTDKNPQLGIRVPVSYPTLNRGERVAFGQIEDNVRYLWTCVTTKNNHVEDTIKWLDYKYSPDGIELFNYGIDGKTYVMVNGKPQYTDFITSDPVRGMWEMGMLAGINHNGPNVALKLATETIRKPDIAKTESANYWGNSTFEKIMPPTSMTPAEAADFASVMTEIQTYVDDMFLRFIMGKEPLSGFEGFVARVKSMGIDRAIGIKQAALERYNRR